MTSYLKAIFDELRKIRDELYEIRRAFAGWKPQPINIEPSKLLALSDHLRKSYMVVATKGECNTDNVSAQTGRSRAIESSYLNQLVALGWLSKRQDHRAVLFRRKEQ